MYFTVTKNVIHMFPVDPLLSVGDCLKTITFYCFLLHIVVLIVYGQSAWLGDGAMNTRPCRCSSLRHLKNKLAVTTDYKSSYTPIKPVWAYYIVNCGKFVNLSYFTCAFLLKVSLLYILIIC